MLYVALQVIPILHCSIRLGYRVLMANETKTTAPKRSGIQAPVALARTVRSISEAALGKVGQSFATLVSHWQQIVGAELANKCLPIAMNFPRGKNTHAVLHLATHSAFALELSHQSPVIIERINAFLGFSAIADLRFDHTMLARPESKIVTAAFRGTGGHTMAAPAPIANNDDAVPTEVCQIYSDIKDPELRERLKSLCQAVAKAA